MPGFNIEDVENPPQTLDPSSFIYVQPPSTLDHLICPICKLPFTNPYSTLCGHTFCKLCLFESLKSILGKKCPLDRIQLNVPTELLEGLHHEYESNNDIDNDNQNNDEDGDNDDTDIYPAPIILTNMTEDLKVKCLNHERGCDWVGQRWSLKIHLVSNCPFTNIKCQCTEFVQRQYYKSDHCVHKEIECFKCFNLVKEIDIESHLDNVCELNLVKCTGCQLMFPKMYITDHEEKCPKIYLHCPGKVNGCDWKGQRDLLLNIHENECVFLKLKSKFDSIDLSLKDLTDENVSLKLQISSILDAVVNGKIQNLGYNFNEISDVKDLQRLEPSKPMKINMGKVKMMVGELDLNRRITETLVQENVTLREEIANQRAVLTTMRQQMQYILLDRHRKNSKSGDSIDNLKLSTKL